MKHLLLILVTSLLFACNSKKSNKENPITKPETPKQNHVGDSVLENKTMDFVTQMENSRKRKPPRDTGTVTPPPPVQSGCLLLDFDGYLVSGTMWNVNGDFVAASSGITDQTSIQYIIDRVKSDYSIFPNITVTISEAVFNSYPQNKRMRCVITSDCNIVGYSCNVGGVTYLNSFSWYDNTPCFVFPAPYGYNTQLVANAVSHELGHSLGCRHQSSYDSSCVKLDEYNYGADGIFPIMGGTRVDYTPKWWIGPNSLGCTWIQNDTLVISNTLKQ